MKGKIKVENRGLNVDLSGEISSEDIKEINNLLRLFSQVSQLEQFDKSLLGEISSDLKNNKEFSKIQDMLQEEHDDYHYVKYTKLNKIIEIIQDDGKIKTTSKINHKELNDKLKSLFDDIEVPNLDFVLVHTAGDMDLSEHEKVYFAIQDRLIEVPSKHIVTEKDTNKVLREVVFFGQDVVDESLFDLD
ncbi:MAG: hypothetical protein ACLFN8_04250 [Candidatus Woesearchaeota archaeon]